LPAKNEATVTTYPDLFEKCFAYKDPERVQALGIYPYFHPLQSAPGNEVVVDGRKCIMVGSNNYLGLVDHPKVKEAAAQAALRFGSGCTGSRFLNGTLDLHLELEDRLAKFMKRPERWCSQPVSKPISAPFRLSWARATPWFGPR